MLFFPEQTNFTTPLCYALKAPISYHAPLEHAQSAQLDAGTSPVQCVAQLNTSATATPISNGCYETEPPSYLTLLVQRTGSSELSALSLPGSFYDVVNAVSAHAPPQRVSAIPEEFHECKQSCRDVLSLHDIIGPNRRESRFRLYGFVSHQVLGQIFAVTTNRGPIIVSLTATPLPACGVWWSPTESARPVITDCCAGCLRTRVLTLPNHSNGIGGDANDAAPTLSLVSESGAPLVVSETKSSRKSVTAFALSDGSVSASSVRKERIRVLEDCSAVEYSADGHFMTVYSPTTHNLRVFWLSLDKTANSAKIIGGYTSASRTTLIHECLALCPPALARREPKFAVIELLPNATSIHFFAFALLLT